MTPAILVVASRLTVQRNRGAGPGALGASRIRRSDGGVLVDLDDKGFVQDGQVN
jgi:hypothetical protein